MGSEIKVGRKSAKGKKRYKILIIAGLALALLSGLLAVQYRLTKLDPADCVDRESMLVLVAPSLREVYDRYIHLEAVETVLSRREWSGMRQGLLQFKAMRLSKNPLFRKILGVPAWVTVSQQRATLLLFDLGPLSMVSRYLPFLPGLRSEKGLSTERRNGKPYLRFTGANGAVTWILPWKNLLLVSTRLDVIESALSLRGTSGSILKAYDPALLSRLTAAGGGKIRVLADTPVLLTQVFPASEALRKVLSAVKLEARTLITADIDSGRLDIKAEAGLISLTGPFEDMPRHRPMRPAGLDLLPEDTSAFTSVDLSPLPDWLKTWAFIRGSDPSALLAPADSAAQLVFGTNVAGLLFGWADDGVGAALLAASPDPVIFMRLSDRRIFGESLLRLTNTPVLGAETAATVDGTPLVHLALPGFVQGLLTAFDIRLSTPWYFVSGDTLCVSMEPRNLARIDQAVRERKTLRETQLYRGLVAGLPAEPGIQAWFNLDSGAPFFLRGDGLLPSLLALYPKGILTLSVEADRIRAAISASGVLGGEARPWPGYPTLLEGGIDGDGLLLRNGMVSDARYIYRDRDGKIRSHFLVARTNYALSGFDHARLFRGDGEGRFGLFCPDGVFTVQDASGTTQPGFPVQTALPEDAWVQPDQGGGWIFYDRKDGRFVFYGSDAKKSEWGTRLPRPLAGRALRTKSGLTFATRGFDGKVFLSDEAGIPRPGFPVESGGLAAGGPLEWEISGKTAIALLLQNGTLHAWDTGGKEFAGWPVTIPGGYSSQPVLVRLGGMDALAAIDVNGRLMLVSSDGTVLQSRDGDGVDGRKAELQPFDADGDGQDELFVTGGMDRTFGYRLPSFSPLPGFPLSGGGKPYFADLNSDGIPELIAVGVNGNLNIRSLRIRKDEL